MSEGLQSTFDGTDILMNTLFTLIALTVITLLILLIVGLKILTERYCCRPIVNLIRAIERKLMFNMLLRGLLESYFMMSVYMWYAWRS